MFRIPGMGLAKGMGTTLIRFFERKATVQYPEVRQDISPHHRGRLVLLYDEWGALKCETCFQCAQACPIECIDMGGVDTKNRYHIHWGPPEQYAERREESALRRSGRPAPPPPRRPPGGRAPARVARFAGGRGTMSTDSGGAAACGSRRIARRLPDGP